MNPFAISGLLITVTCFSLTVLILAKAQRSSLNTLMALFNFCVGVWGLGTMQVGMAQTPQSALWFWRLAHIGGYFLGMVFYHLSSVISGRSRKPSPKVVYLFAFVSVLLCLTGPFMSKTRWMFSSLHYHQANMWYGATVVIWSYIVVLGHMNLFQGYRKAQGVERGRLRFTFYAMAIGFVGGVTTWLPMFRVPLYPYGNFSIPVYALIVSYAIVKHRLMDIEIAITQTSVLLGTYLVVLGAPFVVGWHGRGWLEQWMGEQWWLVPVGLSTVLATIGPFAYAFLRRKAEERLLRDQRRYQRLLQHAARGMTRVRDLGKLIRLIVRVVSRTVRVQRASLLLWDKATDSYVLNASHGPRRLTVQSQYALESSHPLLQWLYAHRAVLSREGFAQGADPAIERELANVGATLVIPGFIEDELVGFLVLGDKLSGEGYSTDDLHAFSTLAHEAAVAIENARSYEELLKVNEQLRVAYERLVQQERLAAAGQFATGMAHEIKNPLSAIKTFAEFLPEKYQEKDFREKFFRIVQSEIARINDLVTELSDFAKPAPLQLQPVSVSGLLEDTLSLLSNQCLKQGVEIRRAFRENGLSIQADPQQLKQVLLNLLLNSLDAMPSGGRLEVATALADGTLRVTIADTGCGIPEELLPKLWDPFFTTKERGMGLGLAIVKGVVERHGGRIAIQSQPGEGTMVSMELPISKQT